VKQSPSWDVDGRIAVKKSPRPFMEP
jgi:hypothetical protein